MVPEALCPVGWSYNEVADKCHIYSEKELNFADAIDNCKSIAGDEFEDATLASIHSLEEFNFLESKLPH